MPRDAAPVEEHDSRPAVGAHGARLAVNDQEITRELRATVAVPATSAGSFRAGRLVGVSIAGIWQIAMHREE